MKNSDLKKNTRTNVAYKNLEVKVFVLFNSRMNNKTKRKSTKNKYYEENGEE